ncbi:winged helix-turn-helix transcriptional regulator [Ruegeria jejuensis]|uniref:winged helix-turn-helix transcriptional regulator n=1 Tax=Ruegeria jejuensis TaxID=3233338 RepID=UPI00355C9713
MTRKSLADVNCSWAQAAEAVGDKWSTMILRDAFFGVRTFTAFEKSIGISKNILTQRLQHLQDHGILDKIPVGVGTTRTEYRLTDKGRGLLPVMIAMAQWSDQWVFGADKAPFRYVDRETNSDVKPLKVITESGREVELDDLTILDGPGANDANRLAVAAIQKAEGKH